MRPALPAQRCGKARSIVAGRRNARAYVRAMAKVGTHRRRMPESTDRVAAERMQTHKAPKRALAAPVKAKIGKRTPSVGPKKGAGASRKSTSRSRPY
jgi:hypothetical protein